MDTKDNHTQIKTTKTELTQKTLKETSFVQKKTYPSRLSTFKLQKEGVALYALGGYGKLIANMTALVYGKNIILIDCGKGKEIPPYMHDSISREKLDSFPDRYPKLNTLSEFIDQGYSIKAFFISHHHGDHIAGFTELSRHLRKKDIDKSAIPTYCSDVTAYFGKKHVQGFPSATGLIYLSDKDPKSWTNIDENCDFRSFKLKHSSLCSSALYFRINGKKILFLPDHHIDYSAPIGPDQHQIDQQLEAIYQEKPDLLILEGTSVTNVGKEDITEGVVNAALRSRISRLNYCSDLIVVSTYGSNPNRLNTILQAGYESSRTVVFMGRGASQSYIAFNTLGLFKKEYCTNALIMDDTLVEQISKNKNKYIIATTGHMGQTNSGLYKLAGLDSEYKSLSLSEKDTVILSSTTIPKEGPRYTRGEILHYLRQKRVTIYDADQRAELHCSGHIGREDYEKYIKQAFPHFNNIVINHGDLHSSLAIYPLMARLGVYHQERRKVLVLSDNQWFIMP